MTKKILFAVMCALLLLVIVMCCIVFGKVYSLLSVAQPPQSTPSTQAPQTDQPTTSAPAETDPPRPSEPPHDHVFRLIESIEANCTSFGYNVYVCECGKTHIPEAEFSNPLGHNYEEGEPVIRTCTQDGYIPFVCSHCQDLEKREFEEAPGHILENGIVTDPQCDADGYTTYHCPVCNEDVIDDIVEGPGHIYGDWITISEAGDSTPGCCERTCSVCDDVQIQWLQPLGTLAIQSQTSQVLTDEDGLEFTRYVIAVGTALTPDAYIYTVNSYVPDTLFFTYNENGLCVFVAEFPEDLLHSFALYESGSWTLKIEPPTNPDLDQNPPAQNEDIT